MKKGVFAIALTAVFLASSQTNGSYAKKSPLDGAWELVSGQQLPKGARDIKIISGGQFIFVAYDMDHSGSPCTIRTETGEENPRMETRNQHRRTVRKKDLFGIL